MINKLRLLVKDQSGESLAEVLVAVLVSGLGMLVLATTINVSVRLLDQEKAAAKSYYDAEQKLADGANWKNQTQISISATNMITQDTYAISGLDTYSPLQTVAILRSDPITLPGNVTAYAYKKK